MGVIDVFSKRNKPLPDVFRYDALPEALRVQLVHVLKEDCFLGHPEVWAFISKGIAKEHLNNVCRMFYRATDDGAGSGLGLYIVKETIDKLNGSIKIDSVEGKGTTIQLLIPEVILN